MIQVSIEQGDIDPFGYQENKDPLGNFNRALPSMTSKVFESIVDEASFGILNIWNSKPLT